jgi:hypothetical protein
LFVLFEIFLSTTSYIPTQQLLGREYHSNKPHPLTQSHLLFQLLLLASKEAEERARDGGFGLSTVDSDAEVFGEAGWLSTVIKLNGWYSMSEQEGVK